MFGVVNTFQGRFSAPRFHAFSGTMTSIAVKYPIVMGLSTLQVDSIIDELGPNPF